MQGSISANVIKFGEVLYVSGLTKSMHALCRVNSR